MINHMIRLNPAQIKYIHFPQPKKWESQATFSYWK